MNHRTNLLTSSYSPQLSIVVYKSESENEFFLESHSINEQGQILEGKPLLQETLQGIVDVFFDERKNTSAIQGIIPDNLLSYTLLPGGNYRMVWFRPAEIRVIHFAKELKLDTNRCWVPAIVYLAERDDLSVYALKANTRPTENTKLFTAPFHNVADDGDVCLGNSIVKKPAVKTYLSLMKYWEDLFWLSEFTHLNGSNKTKSDMGKVWKRLLASKTKIKWSDTKELLPYEKNTLQSILK